MEIILNIFKFLFSADFRKNVNSIFRLAKSSENWKEDILIYKGSFNKDNEYKIQALIGKITEQLTKQDWDKNNISSINYSITELTRNGIEHSKTTKETKVIIEICNNYVRIEISDYGTGFDLKNELIAQNVFDDNSRKCKALGIIYRMSTILKQKKGNGKHIIIAHLIKGYNYSRVYKRDNITVFEFNSSTGLGGYFWATMINSLKNLKVDDKIIIFFYNITDMASSAAESINSIVYPTGTNDDKKEVSILNQDGNIKSTQVVICGNDEMNYIIERYLKANYEYFSTINEALEFFKTGKKTIPVETPITLPRPSDWENNDFKI